METHKNKQTRRTATKIFHIGHDIVSSGVAGAPSGSTS